MLRPFTSLLLFFSLLSLSLQASPTKRFPHASSESDFSERANPETLRKYVFDLSAPSMKGRLTGSPLGKAAEEYVKNVMESLNLSVTVQSFSFPLYEVVAPVSLTVKEGVPGSKAALSSTSKIFVKWITRVLARPPASWSSSDTAWTRPPPPVT